MGSVAGIARRDGKRAPMQLLDSATVATASGVADDFRGRPGKRQVTLLSAEAWARVCSELDRNLPWTTRRSNLLVEGLDLPQRSGDVIRIGDVRLLVTMEVDPCSRMDEQCAGLRKALASEWRGGVACTVLAGGEIRLGDTVDLDESD